MDIITLFCEVDDFFLAFEKYQAQHQLPETPGSRKTRVDLGVFIRAKS